MFNGIGFSSVFKIEEKPILRPCLSESKREEIQRFKAKALAIERRLAEKNKNLTDDVAKHTNIEEDRTEENTRYCVEDIESCSGQSENPTDLDNENFVTSISDWEISSIRGFDYDNSAATETVDCSENVNDQQGPADQSNENENTVVPKLIRSDSFIVDEPSECFLKQLECSGIPMVVVPSNLPTLDVDAPTGTELRHFNQTKVFAKPVEKRRPETKKNATPKTKKCPLKPFPFRKARIPSDNISNLPDKLIRKCQNNTIGAVDIRRERPQKGVAKQSSAVSNSARKGNSISETDTVNYECCTNDTSSVDVRVAQIVANIEEKFRNEIVSFLDKQKREQDDFLRKLMSEVKVKQDAFQCNLFMQIKELIGDGVSTLLKNQDNITVLDSTTHLMNDVNGNVSLLEINDNDDRQNKEIRAATKINAFVRGYLTRRLFKTEQVQKVIKTIRDSLYLVIDLHFEHTDVESVADIQMKHNLLQQLESNRYNLSHIFVTKTPAEQMAIIACDRQIMINRLVKSNSTNRIKEPLTNRPRSTSVEDKLKKLKPIKLFTDCISADEARPCQDT
ncbi:uncharacterized protein LOC119068612 isoform X2 [Bradysia coprophila]|uniref:uncharacterized protein LOC119068612 isoform X2 n=1 Tax=Bradysia coprophila TaxID=38358 RepID=UPI00187DA90B|nr:uncharacterized protein LOC119068612 isoform X2 [Bradysia coprophila]